MIVKYNLVAVRKSHHMTQRELAHRSGVSPAMISFIERGKRQPTFETLFLLAMALEVKISELISLPNEALAAKYLG